MNELIYFFQVYLDIIKRTKIGSTEQYSINGQIPRMYEYHVWFSTELDEVEKVHSLNFSRKYFERKM
jgi:hypothetical protein